MACYLRQFKSSVIVIISSIKFLLSPKLKEKQGLKYLSFSIVHFKLFVEYFKQQSSAHLSPRVKGLYLFTQLLNNARRVKTKVVLI